VNLGARFVPVLLLGLLIAIHAQLWTGRGSVPSVAQTRDKLAALKAANDQARQTNAQIAADVADLKEGLDMVEERARWELGMVKPNEIYVQVTPPSGAEGKAARN